MNITSHLRRSPTGRRAAALLVAAGLLAQLLSGCAADPSGASEKLSTQIFAMDTVMSLTVYSAKGEGDAQAALDAATEQIYLLQDQLSATDPDSQLSALNRAGGTWTALSASALSLLEQSLQLCEQTGGTLDITAYPATLAWGFPTGEYRIPGAGELAKLSALIDYTAVELNPEQTRARLPQGMALDLGAVAKGYTGDILAELMQSRGIGSALFDLGHSSIQAVGTKPDGSSWRIGLQDPTADGYLAVLALSDLAIGTSGGYQRYFEQGGMLYWHILDPRTAAPARTGLASVTVVGPSGLVCDALSTALFVMGPDQGAQFWRDHPHLAFEVIFILEDGSIRITAGLENSFSLAEGYENREVTVLS